MSEAAAKLRTALKQMFDTGSEVVTAVVTAIDEDTCTCSATVDELEITDVQLRAVIDDKKGFVIFPKVGSTILVQKLGDKEEFFVTMFSEIDGVLIQKDEDTLQLIIADLADQLKAVSAELQKVVVAIGVTPDVPALQLIDAAIDEIKNRNAQLLK